MNALNRVLVVIVVLAALGWVGLALFAPAALETAGHEIMALRARDSPLSWLVVAGLVAALIGLLVLEVLPRKPRAVRLQDGSGVLDVASIRQRVTARLAKLETVHAVKVEVTARPKGAELHLSLLARADVNVPELIEQVSQEIPDEIEGKLGVRLVRLQYYILHEPPGETQQRMITHTPRQAFGPQR